MNAISEPFIGPQGFHLLAADPAEDFRVLAQVPAVVPPMLSALAGSASPRSAEPGFRSLVPASGRSRRGDNRCHRVVEQSRNRAIFHLAREPLAGFRNAHSELNVKAKFDQNGLESMARPGDGGPASARCGGKQWGVK